MRQQRSKQAGYTLVEILVVVIIIGIVAAVVVPQAVESSDIQAMSASRILSSDLEYARDLAISTAKPITVTFNATGESYTLTNASQNIIHPITKAPAYVTNFKQMSGFARVDIIDANFGTGGGQSVTFDETGAPDNSGTVRLQVGAHLYTVTVAAATGTVKVTGS